MKAYEHKMFHLTFTLDQAGKYVSEVEEEITKRLESWANGIGAEGWRVETPNVESSSVSNSGPLKRHFEYEIKAWGSRERIP